MDVTDKFDMKSEESVEAAQTLWTPDKQKRLDDLNAQIALLEAEESPSGTKADEPKDWTDTPQMIRDYASWIDGDDTNKMFDGVFIRKFCQQVTGRKGHEAVDTYFSMYPSFDKDSRPFDGYDPDMKEWSREAQKRMVREHGKIMLRSVASEQAVKDYVNGEYGKMMGMSAGEYEAAKRDNPELIVKKILDAGFYEGKTVPRDVLGPYDAADGMPLTHADVKSVETAKEAQKEDGFWKKLALMAVAQEEGEADRYNALGSSLGVKAADSQAWKRPVTDEEKKEAADRQRALIDRYEKDAGSARRALEVHYALSKMRGLSPDAQDAINRYMSQRKDSGFVFKGDVDELVKFHQQRMSDAMKGGNDEASRAALKDLVSTAEVLSVLDRRYGWANNGRLMNRMACGFNNSLLQAGDSLYTFGRGAGRLVKAAYGWLSSLGDDEDDKTAAKLNDFVSNTLTTVTELEVGGEDTIVGHYAGVALEFAVLPVGFKAVAPSTLKAATGAVMRGLGRGMQAVSKSGGAVARAGRITYRAGRHMKSRPATLVWMNDGSVKARGLSAADKKAGVFASKWERSVADKINEARKNAMRYDIEAAQAAPKRIGALAEEAIAGEDYAASLRLSTLEANGFKYTSGARSKYLSQLADTERKIYADALMELKAGNPSLFSKVENVVREFSEEVPGLAVFAKNDYDRDMGGYDYQIGQGAVEVDEKGNPVVTKGLGTVIQEADEAKVYAFADAATRSTAFFVVPRVVRGAAAGRFGSAAQQKAAKEFVSNLNSLILGKRYSEAKAMLRALECAGSVKSMTGRLVTGTAAMTGAAVGGQAVQNQAYEDLGLGERRDLGDVAFESSIESFLGLGSMEAFMGGVSWMTVATRKRTAPLKDELNSRAAYLFRESALVAAAEDSGMRVDLTELPESPLLARQEVRRRIRQTIGPEAFDRMELEIADGISLFLDSFTKSNVEGRTLTREDVSDASKKYEEWKGTARERYGEEFVRRMEEIESVMHYDPVMESGLVAKFSYQELRDALYGSVKADGTILDEDAVKSSFEKALGISVNSVKSEGGGNLRVSFGVAGKDRGSVLFSLGEIDPKLADGKYDRGWASEALWKLDNGMLGEGAVKIKERLDGVSEADRARLEAGDDVGGILADLSKVAKTPGVFYKSERTGAKYDIATGRIVLNKDLPDHGHAAPHEVGHSGFHAMASDWLSKPTDVKSEDGKRNLTRLELIQGFMRDAGLIGEKDGADIAEEVLIDRLLLGVDADGELSGTVAGIVPLAFRLATERGADAVAKLKRKATRGPGGALRDAGAELADSFVGMFRSVKNKLFGMKPKTTDAFTEFFDGLLKQAKEYYTQTKPGVEAERKAAAEHSKQVRENIEKARNENVELHNGSTKEKETEKGKGEEKSSPPTPPTIEEKREGKEGENKETRGDVELHTDSTTAGTGDSSNVRRNSEGKVTAPFAYGRGKGSKAEFINNELAKIGKVRDTATAEELQAAEAKANEVINAAIDEAIGDLNVGEEFGTGVITTYGEIMARKRADGGLEIQETDKKGMPTGKWKKVDSHGMIGRGLLADYEPPNAEAPSETAEKPVGEAENRPTLEGPENAPTIAPRAEGTDARTESAESPQAAQSKPGETPAEEAQSIGQKLDDILEHVDYKMPVPASWMDGSVGERLVQFANDSTCVTTADVMRALDYWLDSENGIWVHRDQDPNGWHNDQADVAVKSVLDGKVPSNDARRHLGQIVDETGGVQGVVVRRDGEIVVGERINASLDGKPLPPGYTVVPFPAEPGNELMESARKWLGGGEALPAEEKPVAAKPAAQAPVAPAAPTKIVETPSGSLESVKNGSFLVTVNDKDGKRKVRTLSAQHNVFAPYLLTALKEGGFPMPSIAVSNKQNKFGDHHGNDWTVVFGKRTVDPQADFRNILFSADAWTVMDSDRMRAGAKSLDEVVERMKAESKSDMSQMLRAGFDQLVERIASIDEAHSLEAAGRLNGRDRARIEAEKKKFRKVMKDIGLDDEFTDSMVLMAVQDAQADGNPDVWGVVRDTLDDVTSRYLKEPPADIDAWNAKLDEAADRIDECIAAIREVGDDYFEAKPERVVKTSEIAALVAPWHYNGQYEENVQVVETAKKLGIPVFFPKAKANVSSHIPTAEEKQKGLDAKGKAIEKALDATDARFLVCGPMGLRRVVGDKKANEVVKKIERFFQEGWDEAVRAIAQEYRGKPGARPNPSVSDVMRAVKKPLEISVNGQKALVHFAGDPNSGGASSPRIEFVGVGAKLDAGKLEDIRKGKDGLTVGDLLGVESGWIREAYPLVWNAPVKWSELPEGVVLEAKGALAGKQDVQLTTVAKEPLRTEVDTTRGRTRKSLAAAKIEGERFDRDNRDNADRKLGVSIFNERLKGGERGMKALEKDLDSAVQDLIAFEEGWYKSGTFDTHLADELRTRWSRRNHGWYDPETGEVHGGRNGGEFYKVYALFGDPKLDINNQKSVLGKAIEGFLKDMSEAYGKTDKQSVELARNMIREAIQDALSQAYTRFSNVAESRLWAERTGLDRSELAKRGIEEIAEMSEQGLFRGQHVKGRTGTSEKASQRALNYWREVVAKKVDDLFKSMQGDFRRRLDAEIEAEKYSRNARVGLNSNGLIKLRSLAEYERYVANVKLINEENKKKGEKPIVLYPKEEMLAYFYWEHMKGTPGGYVERVDPKTGKGLQGRQYKGGPVKVVSGNKKIGDGTNELFDTVGTGGAEPDVESVDSKSGALYAAEQALAESGTDTGAAHGDASVGVGGHSGAFSADMRGIEAVNNSVKARAEKIRQESGASDSEALRKAVVDEAVAVYLKEGPNRGIPMVQSIVWKLPPEERMPALEEFQKRIAKAAKRGSFLVVGDDAPRRGRVRKGVEDLMAEAAAAIIARTQNRPTKGGVKKDGRTKAREWLESNARKVGVNAADRDAWVSSVLAEAEIIADKVSSTVDAKAVDEAVIRAAQAAADSRQIAGEMLVGYALGSDMGVRGGSSGERAKAMWQNTLRKRAAQARGVDAHELDAAIGSNWNRYVETLGKEGTPYKDGDSLAAAMIAEFTRRIRAKDQAFATMNDAELMSDMRVRAELSRTVAGWLENSAHELAWGDVRTDAERIAARLTGVAAGGNLSAMPTFREAHEYIAKHADRLAGWLDGRRAKDIIKQIEKYIDDHTNGARRPNQQERIEQRKADPVLQQYWGEVKKAIRMTAEAADKRYNEVMRELGMNRDELDAAASENPDEAIQKRYKLLMEAKALQAYGGLKDRPSGEIMDVYDNQIAVDLGGGADAFVKLQQEKIARQKAVRDAFVKELTDFMREHGLDPATGKGRAGTAFLMYNVPDLFRRLQMHLKEGSEAYEYVENFRREMSLGHLAAHEYVATWEAEMRKAFKECFGKDFEKMIGELQRKRDDFDRFSRTGWYIPDGAEKGKEQAVPPDGTHPLNTPTKLSLENLMYIYAACRQGDMETNRKIWGRDEAYMRDLEDTLDRELGEGKAQRFVNWLTSAYAEMRGQLDPIAQEVTGMRILTPTEEYCPLAFIQQRRSADTRRFSVNPFPSFLTRRVNHDLSRLDETQGACRMFEERLQQTGHYIGFARIADEIAGTLDSGDVQTAYANLLGTKVKNDVWSQLSDSLTGGRRDPGQLLNGVRNFVTASSLLGNFSASLKQLEGIGGWGARMGLTNWLKGLVVRSWNSAEVAEACREIEKDGIFRTRGDEGISEAMQTLLDGMDGDAPRTAAGRAYKWYKRHGMDMTRLMDRVASRFMAGNYLVDRRRFYEQNGFSHEAATRAAIADVDYAINETQTSGRPEFLHASQRGGAGGKILAQFAGPRFVRWGMEVEALHRAFVMGDKGAKRRLLSRMVALHLVCGPMLALASALGRAIFGTKDGGDDLDEAERVTYEAAKNMVVGPMSGWFIIGNVLDAGLVTATSPEGYRGMRRYEVPLFSKLGNLTQSTAKIWKDLGECMEWGDFDGEEMDDIRKQTRLLFDMLFSASKNIRGVMVRAGVAEPDE